MLLSQSKLKQILSCCPAGCWRRLRVLCQTTAGDTVFCPQLLRGVWQRRRYDECGRVSHVLFSGRKLNVSLTGTPMLLYALSMNLFYNYDDPVFQILKPSEKKAKYQYGGVNSGRPITPPRTAQAPKKRWAAGPDSPAPTPAGLWPSSLQAASNTPAFSQSACSCVNRNSRSVFFACLWVFLWTWVVFLFF